MERVSEWEQRQMKKTGREKNMRGIQEKMGRKKKIEVQRSDIALSALDFLKPTRIFTFFHRAIVVPFQHFLHFFFIYYLLPFYFFFNF